ncbi:Aquaporin-like [Phytophthora cactorum]|nr:Aquaporin-like [Phytophthora cactorum]
MGVGILFGIHVSEGVSGAHINPAITTALALFKRFQWRKVIPYIVAQTLGAFVAAFLIWAVYKTSLRRRRPRQNDDAGRLRNAPLQ